MRKVSARCLQLALVKKSVNDNSLGGASNESNCAGHSAQAPMASIARALAPAPEAYAAS